jgi:LacI family transcriptional regulator
LPALPTEKSFREAGRASRFRNRVAAGAIGCDDERVPTSHADPRGPSQPDNDRSRATGASVAADARALRRGNRAVRRVALIVESQVAPRRMMLTGVARYIQEHDPWSVYLKPIGVEKSLGSWLRDWGGDGIIAAVAKPDVEVVTTIGVPVVDVIGILKHERVPLVHTNDRSVGRLGGEHLRGKGFRHFAFVQYAGEFWSTERCEGFVEYLRGEGFEPHVYSLNLPGPGSGGPETWESQQQQLADWLAPLPKPLAVMTTNDLMGQQLLEACQRLGASVPEEIAVIGADNDEPICRISSPPLSSVIINDHQRGYEAAALLDRMMNGMPPPKETVFVEPAGVHARASTDSLAIEDAVVVRALRYVREQACEGIGVDDVVRRAHVSRSVLERRFRKTVGRSINEEMIRIRLNRAVELLSGTALELKVIAQRAGFGTQAYMNAVFRAKLGKTPGSFRYAARVPDGREAEA